MLKKTLIAAVLTGVSLCTAVHAQAPNWAKVKIGLDANYPPFSSMGTDGKIVGFDVDIAKAVCEKMKADCSFVQQEFDGMLPALGAKKFDLVVAAVTITEERKKAVDFSDPYCSVPSRWIAKAGYFKDVSPALLKGKKIAVLRNSPRSKYVEQTYTGSDVLLAAKETEVYTELSAGRADIALGSGVVSTEAFLKKPEGKGYVAVGAPLRIPGASDGMGIAMRKGETQLLEKVNAALKAMHADGTYAKLTEKYFDFDVMPK